MLPDRKRPMFFTVDQLLEDNLPNINKHPLIARPTKAMLKYLLHEKQCNEIAEQFAHFQGIDFVDQVLETFDFRFTLVDRELEHIPTSGGVVIFANHPIGSLDALAMIKLISEVRSDIKVVANQLLMALEPLHSILLPVNNMQGGTPKQHLAAIHQHVKSGGALLIFPSGEVSRLCPNGVRDTRWQTGFLKIAKTCRAPMLPILANARNSAAFYGASMLFKPLGSLLLVKEMFKQQSRSMPVRVGGLIPYESIESLRGSLPQQVSKLKTHLYRTGTHKPPLFETLAPIAHPESRSDLWHALKQCELLGHTQDNMAIYLYRHQGTNPIMREIGRLREVAFRAVGEGTGKRRDIDSYDKDYLHLVLWDRDAMEIVGAYRFGCCDKILPGGTDSRGLYSQTLFHYSDEFNEIFAKGLELGRSFVQPKYWGKRSLDYLWFGIGAFLARNPQYRYLFGPVTISNDMQPLAQQMMVHFYRKYFGAEGLATANQSLTLSAAVQSSLDSQYSSGDYLEGFRVLKSNMAALGESIPTLYKQYAEVTETGGTRFLDFGVDPDFGDCIDGLVLVDIEKLKTKKRTRYIDSHRVGKTEEVS
ncbi:lysophospholipid acyltransferase family protein [Shewanella submarina]|uniref:L-ornithine N(alpha)-acyltransferase n=1 Tax=Shewanella submarina TaxID=2016376 RepID=A0ABV7GAU3_9GAMM|nr:lysophospholipid acyltransferase family protein [Shewanella submarina]MCL1037188.1 lysophospholipid acyltransferase family protein [Shewanella submarina]